MTVGPVTYVTDVLIHLQITASAPFRVAISSMHEGWESLQIWCLDTLSTQMLL